MATSGRAVACLALLFALSIFGTCECRLQDTILRSAALPVYPPLARQAQITGDVVLTFDVDQTGSPENLKALRGHPILAKDAIDELKTWKMFIPGREPRQHGCQITFTYSLSKKRVSGAPDLKVFFRGLETLEISSDPPEPQTTGY